MSRLAVTRAEEFLVTPLRALVGNSARKLSDHLDLRTAEDLLRHYPRRYYERGELTDLSQLVVGDHVTVQARIDKIHGRWLDTGRKRHLLKVTLADGNDNKLVLTFFNQHWREKQLHVGAEGLFAGKVEIFNKVHQLTQPQVADIDDTSDFAGALVPVYPSAGKVQSWNVANAVRILLDSLPAELPDPLPAAVRAAEDLPGLVETFRMLHRPADLGDVRRARRRLRYEEAFVLQTVLALRRRDTMALTAIPRRAVDGGLLDAFDERLPFELTEGQRWIGAELAADLAAGHPMHRLLQGEVGSGKTVVALRAMLTVVDAGGQCALLAPTEVLAQQHDRSIRDLLGPLAEGGMLGGDPRGTRVRLLTGSLPAAARRRALLDAASGDAGIVVGTHALLHEGLAFQDLGLVVVDEQHRFGVEQRDALRAKADHPPHVLVMTATPIPRTVAITVFGDLDVSTLGELPAGRIPVETHVVPGDRPVWVDRAWGRVRDAVDSGHRAYVVCPRIGGDAPDAGHDAALLRDSDDEMSVSGEPVQTEIDLEAPLRRPPLAVLDVIEDARRRLPGVSVEVLHGGLAPEVKDDVMRRFDSGEVQVVVATTVVEVGVDVSAATVMVVLDAERFGVSQLHQLRGRVGRGDAPGLCLLVTETAEGSPARQRLDAVAATTDGFELARLDLEQRREGDVLGALQSGRRSSLRSLSVLRDEEIIRDARTYATATVERDPSLERSPALAAAVDELLAAERAAYLEKA